MIQYTYFKRAKLTMLGWAYIFPVASFGLAVQSMYQLSNEVGYLYLSIAVLIFNLLFAAFLLLLMVYRLIRVTE